MLSGMEELFSNYLRLQPPTWVFLSTFLTIGLFLMFHRFWSLRNLDIALILLFTPGIMLVYEGNRLADAPVSVVGSVESVPDVHSTSPSSLRYAGYFWLIVIASLMVVRLLLDTVIVRRPMLDPNLSSGGMLFLGSSMLAYLLVNLSVSNPAPEATTSNGGPGYVLMKTLPSISTVPPKEIEVAEPSATPIPVGFRLVAARSIAIGANLMIILCMVAIGYWHFGNFKTGVGAATLYLLLPYTFYMTGRVDHVLPSAFLLLAILLYRQPFAAGLFLGLAAGVVYYPFSLLPLWCSFYWQRGIRRFTLGFATSIAALIIAMIFLHPNDILQHLGYMFGIKQVAMTGMDGIWGLGWYPLMRIPLILVFVLVSVSFVVWPAQKSLATLMSCSGGIMAATQCWHGFGGGLYLAWFVPLALLTMFRPNLDYCVALEVVRPRRKRPVRTETVSTSLAAFNGWRRGLTLQRKT